MIDLHCHILPGIDDGAPDLAVALEMARMAVADGIVTVACTPHIMPGAYKNTGESIEAAVTRLAAALEEAAIPLHLVTGADVHLAPNLLHELRNGRVPTIGRSRYFLLEPPHHILPPRLHEFVFGLVAAGYVPILTHPERLSWIETHHDLIGRLASAGMLMQVTAGSLTGRFGRRARYWSQRLLDQEVVHLLATDAHGTESRPPVLSRARDVVADRFGDATAIRLVVTNPLRILENVLFSRVNRTDGNQA